MRRPKRSFVAFLIVVIACGRALADLAVYDTTFGTRGSTIVPHPNAIDWGERIIGLPDGRFAIAGATAPKTLDSSALVAVFTAQGTLDAGFGGQGFIRATQISNTNVSLGRDGSGRLLVGGSGNSSSNQGMSVLRLTLDGNVDLSWGSGGVASLHAGPSWDYANAILVQPDGKVLAVGQASSRTDRSDFMTTRFTALGGRDLSFSGGVRVEDFAERDNVIDSMDVATAALLQADGKMLVGGYAWNVRPSADGNNTLNGGFYILRYNPDGTRDWTFGTGGLVMTSFLQSDGWNSAFLTDMKFLPDGRIIAVGGSNHSSVLIAAYRSDGSLDADFGEGGKIEIRDCDSASPQVVVQADGSIRIVAMGTSLYDGLLDARGQLIKWDVLEFPSLPLSGLNFSEYERALVLDDGDILAVGHAAPEPYQLQPDWGYSTDMLVSRFDRPIPRVPEPASLAICGLFIFCVAPSTRRICAMGMRKQIVKAAAFYCRAGSERLY